MKRLPAVIAIVLATSYILCAAPPPRDAVLGNIVFLESPDAGSKLPRSKISTCMSELVRDLNLARKQLPRVLVVQVSPRVAHAMGMDRSVVRRNSGRDPETYYEFWVVGKGTPADYTIALETVLETHFSLQLSEAERKQVIARVVRYVDATISAYGE